MPRSVSATVRPGSLASRLQPTLRPDNGLILRPWEDSDAEEIVAAFSVPDIRHWHMYVVDSLDQAREWIRMRRSNWASESGGNWAIQDASGPVVGRIGLRDINLPLGQAAFTYWVLPDHRGGGVASDAVRAISRWCVDELGLHRLVIAHSTLNEASCRVAGNAGFKLEGTMRSQLRHTDGWHDMHLHALIEDDLR